MAQRHVVTGGGYQAKIILRLQGDFPAHGATRDRVPDHRELAEMLRIKERKGTTRLRRAGQVPCSRAMGKAAVSAT